MWDVIRHPVLPAGTLGLFFVAIYARLTRAAMLEVADLTTFAPPEPRGPRRPRGAARILRNALLPVVCTPGCRPDIWSAARC